MKQKYSSANIERDYMIRRLLELPQLIAETNTTIIGIQEKLAWEKNIYEQLKNELTALQAVSRIL